MKQKTTTSLEALKLIGGGVCLAHTQDATWMVSGALPGERVLVEETRRRAGIIEAQTTAVVENHHPARLKHPCPQTANCGGCDWPHVDGALGGRLKADAAADTARAHPDIAAALRAASVQTSPSSYRLRARLHWDPATGNLGFYGRRSNAVHTLSECRIVSPRLLAAAPTISAALRSHGTAGGDLEWLENLEGTQAIGALVASISCREASAQLGQLKKSLEGVVDGFHFLDSDRNTIGGWGVDAVEMSTPIPLRVPPGAFFQGNRHLVKWLFQRVADLAGPDPVPAWDLHAGVGFLAAAVQWAAPRRLVLVEPNRKSATAAVGNLVDAHVAVGVTAESYCRRHTELPSESLVIIDPPRAGLSRFLRRCIARWRPARILMLACDPATWTRDTAYLIDRGYRLGHVELVDLFPSTHHVEILALLERR